MKKFSKKLAACVCGILFCCICSNTHAAGLAGTWKGFCDNREIQLVLSQTDLQVSGTLELGRETFTVEGSTDNSSDNGSLTLTGTGGNGLFPRSCTADFIIPSPGRMTGTVTVRTSFGLKLFSGEASLLNPDVQVDFTLVIGHAQKPSNIYLFFSVQDGNGKPVTGLKDDDFEIYEDDIFISKYESSRTIFPNPSIYTMATVLLLDMSGSVLEADPPVFASLKDSAAAFLDNVVGEQGQEAAIYYFDGRAQIHKLAEFSKDIAALKATIQSLTVDGIKKTGWDDSTNVNGAVQQGLAALDTARTATGSDELFIGTLVTFTDATDRAHLVSDEAAVASINASTHYSFTIGLGGEVNETHLENLGKSGFAWAQDSDDLDGAFAEIAATIHSQSAKRYILGYCTPSRSGDHRVTLRVKNRPGELNFAFNADGFSGGCDPTDILGGGIIPGDADRCLFQVEPGSIFRPLFARSKRIRLTITSDEPILSRKSTVEISGMTVLSTRYAWGKLLVTAVLPPKAPKDDYDITITNTEAKFICFDVLTVK